MRTRASAVRRGSAQVAFMSLFVSVEMVAHLDPKVARLSLQACALEQVSRQTSVSFCMRGKERVPCTAPRHVACSRGGFRYGP